MTAAIGCGLCVRIAEGEKKVLDLRMEGAFPVSL